MIKENLSRIQQYIDEAAGRVGRAGATVTLVAVTKTQPVENIQQVVDAGVLDLAENRVQELVTKFPLVEGDIRWHLIGSLQTNKVKQIIDKVYLIHSLDRWSLAEEIDQRAGQHGLVCRVLIQVNVSGELSKQGISPEEVPDFVRRAASLSGLSICGLMTMAPFFTEPEDTREVFRKLKDLAQSVANMNLPGVSMDCLSMGMSNDFQVAIEEGATMVRIGSDIFNPRG